MESVLLMKDPKKLMMTIYVHLHIDAIKYKLDCQQEVNGMISINKFQKVGC